MNVVNPEAIGVFGLVITVWGFGLDRETDHARPGKNLANIALCFGGIAQIVTALCLYLFESACLQNQGFTSGPFSRPMVSSGSS